ncbi:MAG TPA: DNA cytosine methyltransferase [Chlamydiales bacterium]|jgi:DNA (cytosine-5)-methyltransferase 1|nr:DNA cytosine methyltransferase [Chlamydiales bacterium]
MGKIIPTGKSWFSGGGLMDMGLMEGGVDIIQSHDLDKRATRAMIANEKIFGHKIVNGDVSDALAKQQPGSHVNFFTWPCKKYSTMADIHGTRTGEELFLHALRLQCLEKNEMYVLENVPGMTKFKVVMEAFTSLPDYYVTVICPVNASNWLPQNRERLIIFGTRKPFNVSAPTKARNIPTIKSILERNPKVKLNPSVISRIKGEYRDMPIIVDPSDPHSIAPTCVAHYAKDMGTRMVKDKRFRYGLRPFTYREYARLQGVPDNYILPDNHYAYELVGNGVARPMARWIGKQVVKYFN